MTKKIFYLFVLVLLGGGFFLTNGGKVYAQAGRSLTIIPPKFDGLFANPGDTAVETLRVRNDSDTPVTYGIKIEDFTTSGEEGQVVLEEGESDKNFSLASWIEMETSDIVLQPLEERTISFVINVPRNAEPGGHYASILFQSTAEQIPGNAAVAQRVGSLVLLRVSGNVDENAELLTFSTPNYQKSGPITFSMRVENKGNVHVQPQGTIIIKNMFGKKVAEIPLDSRNVLPGAVRKMDTVWNQERLLGRYTATLISQYGEGAKKNTLSAAINFTVASPVAIVLIVVGTIAVLGILVFMIAGWGRMSKAMKMIATGK